MPTFGAIQLAVGMLFAVLTVGVVIVLILVAQHARGPAVPYAEVTGPGYALRRIWFYVVVAVAVCAIVATLFALPYPAAVRAHHALIVPAVGHQYYWQFGTTHFRAGQTVNFAVTSSDVNHGFGLYDPWGVLIAQTQSMPGYVNHLIVTFQRAGTYTVRCMEYCGLAHHAMETTLVVTGR